MSKGVFKFVAFGLTVIVIIAVFVIVINEIFSHINNPITGYMVVIVTLVALSIIGVALVNIGRKYIFK